MSTIQAPVIIDQPSNPENDFGMSLSVSNLTVGNYLYLGSRHRAEKLQVTDISFHDNMWYLTVVDVNHNQFTVRYQINARVSVAQI